MYERESSGVDDLFAETLDVVEVGRAVRRAQLTDSQVTPMAARRSAWSGKTGGS